MSRDSINLFKKRFLEYNRVRYTDDVNWKIALDSLKVEDINVLKYTPDPDSQYRTVLTEVQSDKFNLSGLDQKYTKAYFGTDIIALLSDRTIYPDLLSVLNLNIEGIFFYQNAVEPEFPHVVIATNFLRRWDDGLTFINEVLETINKFTRYDITLADCSFDKNEEDSSGDREVIDVNITNHTIWGSIKVGQMPAVYPLGTYPYEYLGKFSENHLISRERLLEIANIPDSEMDEAHRLDDPLIWLKFRYYGKIVYIPKYPILTDVSWDLLNSRNMCLGKSIVTALDGNEYRLRLPVISDEDNESEWHNLIKRCVEASGMTEWEAFNFTEEMQYYYSDGSTRHYSSVLTEGYDYTEQHYLVGGASDVGYKAPVMSSAKTLSTSVEGIPTLIHCGWLPVLEFRGVDPIQTDTIHPHWNDLKDPIPEQLYADVEPDPDMVFNIRVVDTEALGPDESTLSVEVSGLSDVKKIVLTTVSQETEIEDPSMVVSTDGTGSVTKAVLVSLQDPGLNKDTVDLDVASTSDANTIYLTGHDTLFATVSDGYATVKSRLDQELKFVFVTRTTDPATLTEPYCQRSPIVVV